MPEENGKLVVSDDVIKLCNSTVPDTARLTPVHVKYNEGLPPTLIGRRAPRQTLSVLAQGDSMPKQGNDFSQLDADFVRVLEDLIDALIANGTLRMTDLPIQAQQKLTQRKQQRARLSEHLDLLDDEDGQVI